jgi:uncharacterized protein YciI
MPEGTPSIKSQEDPSRVLPCPDKFIIFSGYWQIMQVPGAPRQPEKKYFFLKLLSPRPTFPGDMNETEAKMMQAHVAYWKVMAENGTIVVFGPVADPRGTWGMAVAEVADIDEVRSMTAGDPAILSGLGFSYEVYPMTRAIVRGPCIP